MEIISWIIAAAAIAVAVYAWRESKKSNTSRDEFKELFEVGDVDYKQAQGQIQELLLGLNEKNIVMERASLSLDIAGKKMLDQTAIIQALDEKLRLNEANYDKLLGQKKSSEVRTGMIAEQIAPFLEDYPMNPRTARFIGDPIDFVHFDEDKVTFVEVKSGKSQLSKKQRNIRDLIKDGKVEFTIYRVKGDTPPKKDDDDGDKGSS
jgi:predicted Holliday junction resolvase-like endonuclease